ncbi:34ff5c15-3918-4023-8045-a0dc33eb7527 [Sclerotinia trifoliorum]|uniref:Molybdopterin synthase sulfur carrier subunit n=1 Tax=Sclerotinia trifoliorum TaxID=28548 RepID=A0A8H2VZV0_9HELO|nr:34ff5c15-3918-4023-8045-a0dc33eb7527 [Sclerotinia trifoliorum]
MIKIFLCYHTHIHVDIELFRAFISDFSKIMSHSKGGQFTILYFATASSYTSKDSEAFPAPLPLSRLFETLEHRYNGMKDQVLRSCLVTINLEYIDIPVGISDSPEIIIKDGDEVAIIPPVSSG